MHRRTQRENQLQGFKDTKLRAVIEGEVVEMPLVNIAKTARRELARACAFVKAMDDKVDAGVPGEEAAGTTTTSETA